jgi:hypothetical protein
VTRDLRTKQNENLISENRRRVGTRGHIVDGRS